MGLPDPPIRLLFDLTLFLWVVFELGLRMRERLAGRGGTARDRGTRVIIRLGFEGAVVLAILAVPAAHSVRAPAAFRLAGVLMVWSGLGIRGWAVATLGRSFRTTVEVDADQVVIDTGPYHWVRHPSYSGLLLIIVGLGLGLANWASLVVCLVLPLPTLLWRIHVEEAELESVIGEPYRAYRGRTRRLIPGVW